MDLSIIIVNYNTKELLKKCLFSIVTKQQGNKVTKQQSSNITMEIIIVDNGSEEKIKNQISKLKIKYQNSKIKLIENKENLGFSKANNQAIQQAQGEYILLLNPDTIVPRDTLPLMIKFMEKNKDIGIATCRVELPSGELDDACHRGLPTPWNAFCYFSGLAKIFPKSKFFNGYHLGYQEMDKIHEIDACVGAFMLIRRQAGEEVGWFDEDYFWYGEDLDFCFRIKKVSWKVMFIPQVKITHYKGAASGIKNQSKLITTASEKTQKMAQKARFEAMKIFYEKHYRNKYPVWVKWLVMRGIRLVQLATFSF